MDRAEAKSEERELLERIRAGENAAFGEVFEVHVGAVRRLARGLVSDASEAEDVTAETFFRVLQAVRRGNGPRDNLRAYLLTVARRVSWEWHGSRRDVPVPDDQLIRQAGTGPDSQNRTAEVALITRAFSALPERWRTVLWQTEVEGEQPAALGPHLGLSPNATAVLARRARVGLRAAYLQAHLAVTGMSGECRAVTEKLGAYAAGSVKQNEARKIDAHLADCQSCRSTHGELLDLCSSLRSHSGVLVLLVPATGLALGAGGVGGLGLGGTSGAVAGATGTGGAMAGAGSATVAGGATVAAGLNFPVGLVLAGTAAVSAVGVGVVGAPLGDGHGGALHLPGGGQQTELNVGMPRQAEQLGTEPVTGLAELQRPAGGENGGGPAAEPGSAQPATEFSLPSQASPTAAAAVNGQRRGDKASTPSGVPPTTARAIGPPARGVTTADGDAADTPDPAGSPDPVTEEAASPGGKAPAVPMNDAGPPAGDPPGKGVSKGEGPPPHAPNCAEQGRCPDSHAPASHAPPFGRSEPVETGDEDAPVEEDQEEALPPG